MAVAKKPSLPLADESVTARYPSTSHTASALCCSENTATTGNNGSPEHATADQAMESGGTRQQILVSLLKKGPQTASAVACDLCLTAAGIRRHLDILLDDGLIRSYTYPSSRQQESCSGVSSTASASSGHRGASTRKRSRGRPAKAFELTDKGRELFGHDYDKLAVSALAALRDIAGPEAVKELARRRIEGIVSRVRPAKKDDVQSVEETANALAEAFAEHGYAATATAAGGGIQICRHHCPVSHVAAQYPELCEAEHEVIAELTGLHVQPLASIRDGNGVCTTNIPLTAITHSP